MTGMGDEHLKELVTIRKLLMLGLMRSGMSQAQLGAALGVHQTMIGKMFPSGALGLQKKSGAKKATAAEAATKA